MTGRFPLEADRLPILLPTTSKSMEPAVSVTEREVAVMRPVCVRLPLPTRTTAPPLRPLAPMPKPVVSVKEIDRPGLLPLNAATTLSLRSSVTAPAEAVTSSEDALMAAVCVRSPPTLRKAAPA